MRVQCINKTSLALFCRFVLQLPHTILSLSLFDVPSGPLAHFSSSFSHLSLCTRDASLCLYRRPMSWWPLRSLKTARVSEGTVGGATGNEGWYHHPYLFHRKWGGQGDDASGAEDAPDPEAGQHRGAEGSFSPERETLPGLRICWEGQSNSAVFFSSERTCCSVLPSLDIL